MTVQKRFALVIVTVVVLGISVAGAVLAGEPQRHVVGATEIQARIDRQAGQEDADRQVIQDLLQRPEIRQIAGAAGLDLERASAAAAVLSGPSLEKLAAQVRDAGLAGGNQTVVISATTLIIILLLLILLLR